MVTLSSQATSEITAIEATGAGLPATAEDLFPSLPSSNIGLTAHQLILKSTSSGITKEVSLTFVATSIYFSPNL